MKNQLENKRRGMLQPMACCLLLLVLHSGEVLGRNLLSNASGGSRIPLARNLAPNNGRCNNNNRRTRTQPKDLQYGHQYDKQSQQESDVEMVQEKTHHRQRRQNQKPLQQTSVVTPTAQTSTAVKSMNPVALGIARAGASTAASMGVKTITVTQKSVFNFFSGGVAGTIASCITNPLEVIKTQLQSSTVSKVAHGELATGAGHPMTIAKAILERDGVTGFWKGMKPTLVCTCIAEFTKSLDEDRQRWHNLI
jgi:hypothetical protein